MRICFAISAFVVVLGLNSHGFGQTGACCLPDDQCLATSINDCSVLGGIFFGDGSSCAAVCPIQPVGEGACCLPDGSCFSGPGVDAQACDNAGGTYAGSGTSCISGVGGMRVFCPQPPRACCFPDGECMELPTGACTEAGGLAQAPGSDCASVTCPVLEGACCFADESCQVLLELDCVTQGGAYRGDFVPCDPETCIIVPMGACCIPLIGCFEATEPACDEGMVVGGRPGFYQGDGTDCVTMQCPICILVAGNPPGDMNGDGSINGDDIAGFVRAILGQPPQPGEQPLCADYGTGTLDGDLVLFVEDLLS